MNAKLLLATLLLLASPSFAATSARPWVSANFGGSTYTMTDVNAEVGNINSVLAGTGLSMNEVTRGAVFGATAGVDLGGGFSVGLGYDHLAAKTAVGDATGSIEYEMPGSLIRALGRYSFTPAAKSGGFVEASIGRVSTAGTVRISVTGSGSNSSAVKGSGLAFELGAGGQVWTASQVGFIGGVGYRRASSGSVTVAGNPVHNQDGSEYTIDYSGMFVRAGIAVAFTK